MTTSIKSSSNNRRILITVITSTTQHDFQRGVSATLKLRMFVENCTSKISYNYCNVNYFYQLLLCCFRNTQNILTSQNHEKKFCKRLNNCSIIRWPIFQISIEQRLIFKLWNKFTRYTKRKKMLENNGPRPFG